MTVEQLIKELEKLPQDFDVNISYGNGFSGGWPNIVRIKILGVVDIGYSGNVVILDGEVL